MFSSKMKSRAVSRLSKTKYTEDERVSSVLLKERSEMLMFYNVRSADRTLCLSIPLLQNTPHRDNFITQRSCR